MSTNKAHFLYENEIDNNPTQTLLIVGAALDGPSEKPFQLKSELNPFQYLGKSPLAESYYAAKQSGLTNIILYRINGKYASAKLTYTYQDSDTLEIISTDVLEFTSISASEKYNHISIEIQDNYFIVKGTSGRRRLYDLTQYGTAYSLGNALNKDAFYGLLEFETQILSPDFGMSQFFDDPISPVFFSGGSSEEEYIPNRENEEEVNDTIPKLKERLSSALFGELENDQSEYEPNGEIGSIDFGIIVLADMFHDDDSEITKMLGNFCLNKSIALGQGCLGVVGVRPLYQISKDTLQDKKTDLISLAPGRDKTTSDSTEGERTSGSQIDYSNYIQIIIGDDYLSILPEEPPKPVSLAYIYASSQALLPYYQSMTNKTLSGIRRLSYQFSKKDVEDLSLNGYISIISSVRKGFIPFRAVTASALSTLSSFKSPHYVRISNQISRIIIEHLDNFIGQFSNIVTRKMIEEETLRILRRFLNERVIKDYQVKFDFLDRNTEAQISISFLPYSEVQYINSIVSMPFGEGVVR